MNEIIAVSPQRRQNIRSVLAGLFVAASMPPWGWWPLAFMGLAIFTSVEVSAVSTRQRFTNGFIFGCGWFFPSLAWMWFLTSPGYVIAVALFAALHGLASTVAGRSARHRSQIFVLPATHILVEVLRMSFPFGGVPLATLGIAQVSGPLNRTAAIGGVIVLSWLTWQIAALFSGSLRAKSKKLPLRGFIICACAFLYAAGFVAPRGSDTGDSLDIAAVQGGGPQGTHAVNTDPRQVFERHLQATEIIQSNEAHPIDLIIWPENVINVADFAISEELQEMIIQASRLHAPFAVGITEDVDREHFTNAQVVIGPDGKIIDRYDKVRRVPFGEYMPMRGFLKALGAPVNQVPRDAVAGNAKASLDIPTPSGTKKIAVVISWEIFFGGRAREGVKDGAGLIINPTNGSSYTWTVLQTQQIASSKLRAIETGRWVIQVSPTGFSAFIDPSGNVFQRTGVSEQSVIEKTINIRSGQTIYMALGDKPWIVFLTCVILIGLWQYGKDKILN